MRKRKSKKTPRKNASSALNISLQLKTIDRLLARGEYELALKKTDAALRSLPKHGGLYQRKIVALEELGRAAEAEVSAYFWSSACPKSRNAWYTLYLLSLAHHRAALAQNAAEHYNALPPQAGDSPLPMIDDDVLSTGVVDPFSGKPVTLDDLKRIELGQLLTETRHFEHAIKTLRGNDYTPAQNNLGICLFHTGDFKGAARCFNDVWQEEPKNLVALSWIAKLRLFEGKKDEALVLSKPLSHTPALRLEDAIAQMLGLLLLGLPEEACETFTVTQKQDWWFQTKDLPSMALALHIAGACFAQSGKEAKASQLWNKALEQRPELTITSNNLDDLYAPPEQRNGAWPVYLYEHIPGHWLKQIQKGAEPITVTRPMSNDYLESVARIADPMTFELITTLLRDRARQGDPEAGKRAIDLLAGKQGSPQSRLAVGLELVEAGIIDPDRTIKFWDGETWRDVQLKRMEVHGEPNPGKLNPAQQEEMTTAIDALKRKDLGTARRILEKLSNEVPDEPTVWGNLAATHEHSNDMEKAETALKQALSVDPDYLMGRCNLAMLYLKMDRDDEAKAILPDPHYRTSLHFQEAITLHGVNAVMKAKEGGLDEAIKLLESVQKIAEDYNETARLTSYYDAVTAVTLGSNEDGFFERFTKLLGNY